MGKLIFLNSKDKGFTIVELLVAITVFSFIMIVASAGLIQVGRMYYKSIVVSRTQNVNRSVVDEISRAMQFSGSRPDVRRDNETGQVTRLCVGSTRFTIAIDGGAVGQDDNYAILKDQAGVGCPEMLSIPSDDSTELLSQDMRLTDFDVVRIGNTDNYRIISRVLYGVDDLIEEVDNQQVCRAGISGVEFCAAAELRTMITRRLTGE